MYIYKQASDKCDISNKEIMNYLINHAETIITVEKLYTLCQNKSQKD